MEHQARYARLRSKTFQFKKPLRDIFAGDAVFDQIWKSHNLQALCVEDTQDVAENPPDDEDEEEDEVRQDPPAAADGVIVAAAPASAPRQRQAKAPVAKAKPKATSARQALTGSQRKALQGLRLLSKTST